SFRETVCLNLGGPSDVERRLKSCTCGAFRHHPLEPGAGGRQRRLRRCPGSLGKPVPDVLVSTLRLCAPARLPTGRCPGLDPGVFRPALGEALPAERRPGAWPLSLLSLDGIQAISVQGARSSAGEKTGWWNQTVGPGLRGRRKPVPSRARA